MNSFTVELVSNVSFDCNPKNTLSIFYQVSSRTDKPERRTGGGNNRTLIFIFTPGNYRWNFFYLYAALPDTSPSDYYTIDAGLYSSISDIVN